MTVEEVIQKLKNYPQKAVFTMQDDGAVYAGVRFVMEDDELLMYAYCEEEE